MNKSTARVVLGVALMLFCGFCLFWTSDMRSIIPMVLLLPFAFDMDSDSEDSTT